VSSLKLNPERPNLNSDAPDTYTLLKLKMQEKPIKLKVPSLLVRVIINVLISHQKN